MIQVPEYVRLNDRGFLGKQRQPFPEHVTHMWMTGRMRMNDIWHNFLHSCRNRLRGLFDDTNGQAMPLEFRPARSILQGHHRNIMAAFLKSPRPTASRFFRAAHAQYVHKRNYLHVR